MRRIIALSVALLVIPTLFCQVAQAGGPEPITLAVSEVSPLLKERNQERDFLDDLMKEVSRRIGRPILLREYPWGRCLAQARTGATDGVLGAFKTPEREAFLNFSDESALHEVFALFTRKSSGIAFDGDPARLAHERVGVVRLVSYDDSFEKLVGGGAFSRLERVADAESLIKMLDGNRIDVAVASPQEFWPLARSLGMAEQFEQLSPPMFLQPSYIGYTKSRDMSRTKAAIDDALRALKQEGVFARLQERHRMTEN